MDLLVQFAIRTSKLYEAGRYNLQSLNVCLDCSKHVPVQTVEALLTVKDDFAVAEDMCRIALFAFSIYQYMLFKPKIRQFFVNAFRWIQWMDSRFYYYLKSCRCSI